VSQTSIRDYRPTARLLEKRVILVTGAGQGLGRAAALAFAAHGATVVLHGRSVTKLERIYDEIVAAGSPQPVIFPLDFADARDADFESMAEAIRRQLGRLDGILHNAALFSNLTPLANQTLDQWGELLRVNLMAPFALTRACLPLLLHAPDAAIIMTSETHGHRPAAYWGGFAVAKSGLEALTRIWSLELEMHPNLRINALVPGPVASPQRGSSHPGESRQRLPTPEQLMPYYLFLMGGDSHGTSGQVIEVQAS
jgi:NAD(P)-dependent dehydrogenase (short-subunit alcohol dehydrogenase family)